MDDIIKQFKPVEKKTDILQGFKFFPDESKSGLEDCLGMFPSDAMNNIVRLQSEAIKADLKRPGAYDDFIKNNLGKYQNIPIDGGNGIFIMRKLINKES